MSLVTALTILPAGLRIPLLDAFAEITNNYRQKKWEPSELSGGKFCEIIYTIIRGHIDGVYASSPQPVPKPFIDSCRRLEPFNTTHPRSLCIEIPRVLIGIYEIRNNRGVGHASGTVNPNHMDAHFVLSACQWILAELIRVFHATDIASATAIVEGLVRRQVPVVWTVNGKRRVLNTELTMIEKVLLLLFDESGPINESVILDWVEHSNPTVFRRDVLKPAHKKKLIEYDAQSKQLWISPVGQMRVEQSIPLIVPG
ncbi:MAG TPA: hypothetical protein VKX17_15540 [Planctomycetota bacterium]|nr:hypothetical protein [Planctomycetota bacterium]